MSDPAAFFLEWKQQLLGSLQACFQGGGDPRTPTPSERQHRLHVQRLLSLRSSTFVEQLARLDPARVDTSPLPAPYNELATVHITRCRLFIPLAEAFLSRQPRPAELHRRHSPDGWKIHPPLASTLIQTDQQGTPTDAELQLTAAMNTFATTLVDALSDACSASGSHSQPSGLLPPAALLLGWLLRTALTDLRYGAISAGLAHGNVVRCSSQFLSLLEAILGINAPCNLAGVRLRASLALYAMVQRLALQDPIRKLSRELETAHNQFSRRLPLTVDGQPVFCLKRTSGLMLLSLNPRFFGDYDLSLLYQQVARALLPANVHDAVHYYRQALRHCPPTHTRTIGRILTALIPLSYVVGIRPTQLGVKTLQSHLLVPRPYAELNAIFRNGNIAGLVTFCQQYAPMLKHSGVYFPLARLSQGPLFAAFIRIATPAFGQKTMDLGSLAQVIQVLQQQTQLPPTVLAELDDVVFPTDIAGILDLIYSTNANAAELPNTQQQRPFACQLLLGSSMLLYRGTVVRPQATFYGPVVVSSLDGEQILGGHDLEQVGNVIVHNRTRVDSWNDYVVILPGTKNCL